MLRARLFAFALALLFALACREGEQEGAPDEGPREAETPETPAPKADLDLVPSEELSVLAEGLEEAAGAELTLCRSGYAEAATQALRALATRARTTTEDLDPETASEALAEFAEGAEAAADALAELDPTPSAAERRHLELTAALRDLAEGFSVLAKALREGDEKAARGALARTENGLANVEIAAEAVISACR